MKRLSMLAALSAVVTTGLIGSAAQAQYMTGSVLLQQQERPYAQLPAGTAETGRYARFIMDDRLTDMNFTNRDFENWKPMDVQPKQMMRHFMMGRLQSTPDSPIPDQEIGRYVRQIEDDRLVRNNMEFQDRDFYPFQEPSPYTATAKSAMESRALRGLSVGTNAVPALPRNEFIGPAPRALYFWQ